MRYITREPKPLSIFLFLTLPALLLGALCWWLYSPEGRWPLAILPLSCVLGLVAIGEWRDWVAVRLLRRVEIVYLRKFRHAIPMYMMRDGTFTDDFREAWDFTERIDPANPTPCLDQARAQARRTGATVVRCNLFDAEMQETGRVRVP